LQPPLACGSAVLPDGLRLSADGIDPGQETTSCPIVNAEA